jgi:hypothetical protein
MTPGTLSAIREANQEADMETYLVEMKSHGRVVVKTVSGRSEAHAMERARSLYPKYTIVCAELRK